MKNRWFWSIGTIFMLGACGLTSNPTDSSTSTRQNGSGAATTTAQGLPPNSERAALTHTGVATTPSRLLSCSAEIGSVASASKVAVCRNVSPATHPPCNAANSCAKIESEIARSCSLFYDESAPMAGCGQSPNGVQAAVALLQRYYSAINAHDYDTAWSQWGEHGQPGQTRARFEAGFAHTRKAHITIGKLQPGGGAAGSIYQPVPVTVEATLDDGTRQRFRGVYVLRRVNDVDGASAAQLQWHIGSAQLRRIPAASS